MLAAWKFIITARSLILAAAEDRFFDGGFVPFPVCQAKYNAPCSHTNTRTVVHKAVQELEAATSALEVDRILEQINGGMYNNGADGFGFGPMVAKFDDGKVLADAENPQIAGMGLGSILDFDSSGCDKNNFQEENCFQPMMTIIQQDLLLRWQEAATNGDGIISWIWTSANAPLLKGKPVPDQRVGFVRKAMTPSGELLVASAFTNAPLPLPQPTCSAGNNEICSIEFSRRLVGDGLTQMMLAKTPAELERVFHDITFSSTYKLGSFYIFAYEFKSNEVVTAGMTDVGECVAHGANRLFVGKNLPQILAFIGNTAVDGAALHTKFYKAAEKGGGWVDYGWKNTATAPTTQKVAFIAGVRKFGLNYYLGVGFNHVPSAQQLGPRCTACSASFSSPCSLRNAYLCISHAQSLLLTDVPEDYVWSQLTSEKNSPNGWGQAKSDGTGSGYSWAGGFYNFAYDVNGTCVAHGARGDFVGLTLWEILAFVGLNKDCSADDRVCAITAIDGVVLNNQFVQAAKDGGGWVRYPWRNGADAPQYDKVAYLVKVNKYGREFYVGVGYNRNKKAIAVNCSASFDAACSEDAVLGVVGHSAAAVSNAQSEDDLSAAFSEITYGKDFATGEFSGTGQFKHPEGFFVQAYDESWKCVADGADPAKVGRSLEDIFSPAMEGSKRISAAQFEERILEKASIGGWFEYDWQTNTMEVPEKRWAFTLQTQYSPLGSAERRTFYLISTFVKEPAPARIENGCPVNSEPDVQDGFCHCQQGYLKSFKPSADSGDPTCQHAFDRPMECIDVRGKDCHRLDNSTVVCEPCAQGYYCPEGEPVLCTSGKYCPQGSEFPLMCDDGSVTSGSGMGSIGDCAKCPAGSAFQQSTAAVSPESIAVCSECSAGFHTSLAGSSVCSMCGAGTFAGNAAAVHCTNCSAGNFTDTVAQTVCLRCPPGESAATAGLSTCSRCPQGSFADGVGFTQCKRCPMQGTDTKGLGARSAAECICAEGTFLKESGMCSSCPEKMECPAGSSQLSLRNVAASGKPLTDSEGDPIPFPKVFPGFWTASDDMLSVFRCKNEDMCPGGGPQSCATNLEGQACVRCREGYFWNGDECAECSDPEKSAAVFPLIPILLAFILIPTLYRLFRDPYEKWGSWQNACMAIGFLSLNHYQILSLIKTANITMPSLVTSVFGFWSFTEDVLAIFNVGCGGFGHFSQAMVLKAVAPMVLLLVTVLCTVASRIIAQVTKLDWVLMTTDRVVNVYLSLIFTFFNGIVAMSLSLFKCQDNPNGVATLAKDLSVICYEGDWNSMIVVGVLAVVVYCIGFGGVFAWAIYKAPSQFSNRSFQVRWKFLFIKFRQDVFWWALVLLFRGFMLNAGFVFNVNGVAQLYWVMLAETVYLATTIWKMPWRFTTGNTLSILTSISIMFCCGLNAIYAERDSEIDKTVSIMVVTISFFPCGLAAALVLRTIYTRVLNAAKTEQEMRMQYMLIHKAAEKFVAIKDEVGMKIYANNADWDRWYMMKFQDTVEAEYFGINSSSRVVSLDTVEDYYGGQQRLSEVVKRLSNATAATDATQGASQPEPAGGWARISV